MSTCVQHMCGRFLCYIILRKESLHIPTEENQKHLQLEQCGTDLQSSKNADLK